MKGRWDAERDPLADLRRGEPETFEAFVRSETATFRAFFLRLGAGRAEADDLLQDTFLKLYRHASTYQPQGRFAPFAFRVARNAWIDHQRRRSLRPRRSLIETVEGGEEIDAAARIAAPGEEPHEALSRDEEVQRLYAALAQLSEAHRLVFELGVLQELPYADIAEALSIPVGTVKSRMFHAVRKLRAALEPQERP